MHWPNILRSENNFQICLGAKFDAQGLWSVAVACSGTPAPVLGSPLSINPGLAFCRNLARTRGQRRSGEWWFGQHRSCEHELDAVPGPAATNRGAMVRSRMGLMSGDHPRKGRSRLGVQSFSAAWAEVASMSSTRCDDRQDDAGAMVRSRMGLSGDHRRKGRSRFAVPIVSCCLGGSASISSTR